MSDDSSLNAALEGLPAKPRVHELAKRSGASSKEIIAALAARGHVVTSASSTVEHDAAVAVLTSLLGGPDAEAQVEPAPAAAGPADADTFTAPLFLPPEPVAPSRRRRTPKAQAIGDTPFDEAVERDASDGSSAAIEPAAEAAVLDAAPDDEDGAGQPPTRSARRRRGRGRGPAAADGAEQSVAAEAPVVVIDEVEDVLDAAEDDAESGDGGTGARKRRRRGRRGRGRLPGDDADGTGADTDSTDQDAEARAEGESGRDDQTRDDQSGDDQDGDAQRPDDEGADDEGADGTGTRRRRRRRRRTGGDGAVREDDPDNTVVHVREPRREAPIRESVADEVQGIRGSTRLEAKRQRRRESRGSARRPQILTEAEFLARRESVDRVMAVRQRGNLAQVALLEDDILVEHFVSRAGSASMIGNVYLGKVQNVLPSMEAAFIDIGRGRNAVLYAGEVNWDTAGLAGKGRRIEAALSSGDMVLAQVSKDPVGHKGARLTTQISLPGRFLVYVPGGGATGISRKLPDTERKRLKAILDRIVPEDAGVIIRTAAEGVPEEELARDVERLKNQWEEISRAAEKGNTAPTELSAEPDTLIKVVRDLFNSDINRLLVDGDEAWDAISGYVSSVAPELGDRVSRYAGNGDVFSRYRIDEQIAKALERKVHLPSGGSLVIDRTEAMTVVDVNTGKYTGSGGNLEETVTRNNLEAAEEMVRQLRLRDIGGIIVVDFIDMVLESNRELVLRRLTECLGRDRTRHQVAEVTSLGLVQMTRKRMGTGLVEAFSETCAHCQGRGIVLHDVPVDHGDGGVEQPEARTGKARRNRGKRPDAEPEPAVRVAAVLGVRPDPRGPRPPGRQHDRGDEPVGDDSEFEIIVPGEVAADPGAVERVEAVLAADETVGLDAGEDTVEVQAEASAAVAAVERAAGSENGSAALTTEANDQARAPRRRRAAGRPAGAPTGSAGAVDIVLPAAGSTEQAPSAAAPDPVVAAGAVSSAATDSGPAADAGNGEAPAARTPRKRASRSRKSAAGGVGGSAEASPAADSNGTTLPSDRASEEPVSAPAPQAEVAAPAAPRRRRAASRPAGPAGEPVSVGSSTGPQE